MTPLRPTLYVAITNHGFGHATRTASVVAEIQRLSPEILPILVTSAPRWLLESYLPGDFILRPRSLDIGVVQSDSLRMDLPATLEQLRRIRSHQNSVLRAEVDFIRQNRVSLILADLPPLATAIARSAGLPCWMIGNFGWDFIYRPWGGEFEEMADWISQSFSACDRLFRLPFHEPMSSFPIIEDVGLTGATPRFSPEEIRRQLGLRADRSQTVLLTFGGLGLERIPYYHVQDFPDWQFLVFDPLAPEDFPNLIKLRGKDYRPADLMPCCGRVISKPGYSTFAEACRLQVPIVSLIRSDFAETPLLLQGISDYSQHQILDPPAFFDSPWEFLDQPLMPPSRSDRLPTNGNEAIAQAVVAYLQKS
jgi:hypothetical protein